MYKNKTDYRTPLQIETQLWTERNLSRVVDQFRKQVASTAAYAGIGWTKDLRVWGDPYTRNGERVVRVSFYVTDRLDVTLQQSIAGMASSMTSLMNAGAAEFQFATNGEPMAHICKARIAEKHDCWKIQMYILAPF